VSNKTLGRGKWRYGLVLVGAIFSLLAWWQQTRSLQAAKKDRDEAIKQTSEQVTKSVTEAIGSQYKELIGSLTNQIGNLKGQLAEQGKKVDVIQKSNIVTGKNPIKVEVTNEPSSIGSPSQTEAEKKKRADVRTRLGILLGEATAIKTFCLTDPPPPQFSCVDSANDWARRTLTYIGQNLEQSYQPRFLAATGLSVSYNAAKTEQINNAVNYLTFKAAILEQFIKEFRD